MFFFFFIYNIVILIGCLKLTTIVINFNQHFGLKINEKNVLYNQYKM